MSSTTNSHCPTYFMSDSDAEAYWQIEYDHDAVEIVGLMLDDGASLTKVYDALRKSGYSKEHITIIMRCVNKQRNTS